MTQRIVSLDLSRRGFFGAAGASVGLLSSGSVQAAEAGRKRSFRIAHLTDVHLKPELRASDGFTACLRHVQALKDKPDVIFFGGDCIFEALRATRARTQQQWDLWNRVLQAECSLPWVACIGNHDIWGWNWKTSGAKETDPGYGKAWATEALKMGNRYRSFDKAGWKVIILDSTVPGPKQGLVAAYLDGEQSEWLEGELKSTPRTTPILVMSHVPIFAAVPFLMQPDNEKTGDWVVPGTWLHTDARKLTNLFYERGNVKVCLSGHNHMVDEVKFLGTTYYCNGAVSGSWWEGKHHQFPEGYALVDLYDDGSSTCEYVPYGWVAPPVKKAK
jgi:Icc protein